MRPFLPTYECIVQYDIQDQLTVIVDAEDEDIAWDVAADEVQEQLEGLSIDVLHVSITQVDPMVSDVRY